MIWKENLLLVSEVLKYIGELFYQRCISRPLILEITESYN